MSTAPESKSVLKERIGEVISARMEKTIVVRVERRADTTFARVVCVPTASVSAVRWLMVLNPVTVAERPDPETGEQKP